jgi:hypothetical protein
MILEAKANAAERPSLWVWIGFFLLCVIGAAAAVRRIVVLIVPPVVQRVPQMAALDVTFASRRTLTLCHIVPALLFVMLLPVWVSNRARVRPVVYRRVTYALLVLGVITGATALLLSGHPVGGVNEAAATILYDGLFLFSLARAWVMLRRRNMTLHRRWMIRAIAVLLGIATTRPVMGFFFATQALTHLQPQQFFGTAFWIGFSVTYIAGEAYLRSHPGGGEDREPSGLAAQS